MFAHVDWAHTKAYALGLNSLYLNLAGRERHGIVPPAMRDRVADQIIQRLETLRDPKDGSRVVFQCRPNRPGLSRVTSAPRSRYDCRLGTRDRSSWETALGEVPPMLIADNDDEMARGPLHCSGTRPGVFLSNRKSKISNPWLADVTVTVLHQFRHFTGQRHGWTFYILRYSPFL